MNYLEFSYQQAKKLEHKNIYQAEVISTDELQVNSTISSNNYYSSAMIIFHNKKDTEEKRLCYIRSVTEWEKL